MAGEFLCLVSLHSGHHNKTPGEQFGRVEASSAWQIASLSPLDLSDHISNGLAWVACHLSGSKRNEAAAGASNLIVLDIDGDISLEAFWAKPLVARCCLFTATSCSHSAAEHRFRAVFRCDEHDDPALHKAIYHQWCATLALKLKDNSGEKPERLWYGNDKAELQFGGGEPISWDIIEAAKDALKADLAKRLAPRPAISDADAAKDNARAAYALEQLLRPSADGEFSAYWSPVFNAAAATGSEAVEQAFFCWHSKGHHSKTQKGVAKRFQKAGTRLTPGQGAGVILKLAKEQLGADWWRQLPQSLWFGGGGEAIQAPTVLFRSRSPKDIEPDPDFDISSLTAADDDADPKAQEPPESGGPISLFRLGATGPAVPDRVPSALELMRLADAAAKPASTEPLTLEAKLRRLYMLRAHGLLLLGDDLQEVPEEQRPCLDRDLLGEVLAHPGYCNQPSEVERDLLTLFRHEQGLKDNGHAQVQGIKLVNRTPKRPQWLVPNFVLAGGEHILYAKAGVGKTTVGLHMTRAVTGDPTLDRFLDSGPLNNHHLWQRNPVLFIGTDMFGSAEEMTTKYLEDFGLYGLDFLQQVEWWFEQEDSPAWLLTLKDLTRFYQFLEGHYTNGTPVSAVFIDSMKAVCPDHLLVGQQGFKDYIKLIKVICKRFGAALIWIHHSRQDGSGAQGITRITEGSDANFHMKRDDKTKQLTLEVEKLRGGRSRTLYINPFKPIPQLLPNPEELHDEDHIESSKEQLIIEIIASHFNQHRLVNMTSSAEYIEKTYTGIKAGEIEAQLKASTRGRSAAISRSTLNRILRDLKQAGTISTKGTGSYSLPPHFQPDLSDQADLLDQDDDDQESEIPGW